MCSRCSSWTSVCGISGVLETCLRQGGASDGLHRNSTKSFVRLPDKSTLARVLLRAPWRNTRLCGQELSFHRMVDAIQFSHDWVIGDTRVTRRDNMETHPELQLGKGFVY